MRKNHISDDSTAAIPIARHMLLETDDIDEAHAQVTEVFRRAKARRRVQAECHAKL